MHKTKKKEFIISALGIAFVFIVTSFLVFPLGSIGYINIGDAIILLFAGIVSPRAAFAIGGIGSCLADMMLAPQYMIFTFIIKGLEGYLAATFMSKYNDHSMYLAGFVVIIGYALSDVFLTGQLYMALPSIGFNALQILFSILIAHIGRPFIKRLSKR